MTALRVLSLSTLYPNEQTPNFGVFVERQMQAVMRRKDVDLVMVNPLGIPPFPLSLHTRYAALSRLPGREERGGVTVLRPHFRLVPSIGAHRNARAEVRGVLPLARQLHAEAPFDVIDAQFFYPDGPAAIAIGEALGLPVSIKARGSDIHHWGTAPATREQILAAGRAADGMLAVSQGLVEDMVALGMPRDRIAVHRTGINADLFRPYDRRLCRDQLGLPRDFPILACVGALIERKGQRFALEALRGLPDAILLIAGTGPDENALKNLVDRLGIRRRVHFLGPVPHGDMPIILNAADVFVLPTASEGLANAWVEALACGTPVVTTPIPGARELLSDPACGRMVARDGAAIAAAVRAILTDKPAPEAVSAAVSAWSWEANAEALVAHWTRLARRD
ncbi:glycosyltransferase involved in cell wall biosynthesis [Novosphingobium kunmingense]|uniref:Glycosyltransferase involved in cell wall biosynthesis n=1 Tax=Novosphingobium kunmingense TaxID=1211806 RepID=A0A2N0I1R4_9SPHN|nr:glycosyltransferase [Novosphingobium kunmingense]PKB25111.1 glycosyltransferase involved in cell wall biosynthesis [Novosphingobium kunmingense]